MIETFVEGWTENIGIRYPLSNSVLNQVSNIRIGLTGEASTSDDSKAHKVDDLVVPETADGNFTWIQALESFKEGYQAVGISKVPEEENGSRAPPSSPVLISSPIESADEFENLAKAYMAESDSSTCADFEISVTQPSFDTVGRGSPTVELFKVTEDESKGRNLTCISPVESRNLPKIVSSSGFKIPPGASARCRDVGGLTQNTTCKFGWKQTMDSTREVIHRAKISELRNDATGTRIPQTSPTVLGRPRWVEVESTSGATQTQRLGVACVSPVSPSLEQEVVVNDVDNKPKGRTWYLKDHRPFKLPEPYKDGRESENITDNQINSRTHRQNNHLLAKLPDPIQAEHQEFKAGEVKAAHALSFLRINPMKHPTLEDSQKNDFFLDLANEEIRQLETEIQFCSQDNAGLHGGVGEDMENLFQRATRSGCQHAEGDMDIKQAIKYNQSLLDMQRKYERMNSRLQKAKLDLNGVKHTLSDCIRLKCRCWWCRGYTGLQKGYGAIRKMILPRQPTPREKKRNRVGQRKSSVNMKLCGVYVAVGWDEPEEN